MKDNNISSHTLLSMSLFGTVREEEWKSGTGPIWINMCCSETIKDVVSLRTPTNQKPTKPIQSNQTNDWQQLRSTVEQLSYSQYFLTFTLRIVDEV